MEPLRIPAKTNTDSEGNANGIPGRRRTVVGAQRRWQLDCAGSVRVRQEKPVRSAAQVDRRKRGKGCGERTARPVPAQYTVTRRALARRLRTTLLAHGIPAHVDAMSVMNQAIEDAVGGRGIADLLVPARDRKLRGENGRASLITILADFP